MSPTANLWPLAPAGLADLMQAAKAVFFDFDGPLCDVFFAHPAAPIAEELKTAAKGVWGELPGELESSPDPHAVLRELRLASLGTDGTAEKKRAIVAELEARLAWHEVKAARSAKATAGAADLVVALHKRVKKLLVTSNNAAEAVWVQLRSQRIDGLFDHVVGRNPEDPLLMKPHPYCVNRAVDLVQLPAGDCLLIGDQPTDTEAAAAAGVRFLGYAPDAPHAAALEGSGATDVVASLGDVVKALRPLK